MPVAVLGLTHGGGVSAPTDLISLGFDTELTHHVGPNRTIVACLRNQGKQARKRLKSGAIDSAAPGQHDRSLVY